jgi:pimeloyl-ACP methyl ester carboxylesterase
MTNKPLLLLPGMMCDARLFAPQIASLSASVPLMTLPLNNESTVTALAAHVLQHAPPQFALCGLSMGGIVAMEVIRQAPERVERLALLDTNPLAELPEKAAVREPQIQSALNGNLRGIMRDEMKPHYLSDGPDRQRILDLCMAMAESLGPDVFERQSRALQSRPDQTATLQNVTVPTLVLCGEADALCPVERHELMHSLVPQSQLKVIASAGHLPTLEQPEATSQALMEWLSR